MTEKPPGGHYPESPPVVTETLEEGVRLIRGAIEEWERTHPERTLIIVARPSGGGKNTLIQSLNFPETETTWLSLDRYSIGAEEQRLRDGEVNFSVPQALDEARIRSDVERILAGENGDRINVPVYSMPESRRVGEEEIGVKRRLVVEGAHALRFLPLETPFKIYVDASEEQRLKRKLARDTVERGVSPNVVRERFDKEHEARGERACSPATTPRDVYC